MLALLLGFLFPLPETATNYTFSGYRWVPADAPVDIDACEGTGEVIRGIARSSTVAYGTGFHIRGAKSATRVRVRFTFADSNWQPVRVREENITGVFTPGTTVLRTHRYGGDFRVHDVYPHAGVVLCAPIAVDFSDGSHWSWAPPPAPYTAPGSAGRAESSTIPAPIESTPQPEQTAAPTPKATATVDYN